MTSARWNIIIVEDHDPDVFLIKEALNTYNVHCEVTHFRDSEEAVKRICSGGAADLIDVPDLILLDLNMPRIPGIEVLKCIRATERVAGVRVAILTSSHSGVDRAEAENAGATIYISKHPMLDEFINAVGAAVSGLLNGSAHPR